MKKNNKKAAEAANDKVMIAEAHIRKIMALLGTDDALVSLSIAAGKYIAKHGVDFYDKVELCNRVHSGMQIAAGLMVGDKED